MFSFLIVISPPYMPSVAAASGPFEVEIDSSRFGDGLIDELKAVLEHHKGDVEVRLVMRTSAGPRGLKLGDHYRVRPSSHLTAEIDHLLGQAALAA